VAFTLMTIAMGGSTTNEYSFRAYILIISI